MLRKIRACCALGIVCASLAGCSGYRGGTVLPGSLRAENTTQRGTLSIPTSIPPYTIYVANACGSNAIEAFQTTPNSGVPISAISGSATKLDAPVWLYDSTGNTLWAGSYDNQTVAAYRVGSNGNVAPVGTLEGANVGHPAGIARDANGNTYVADYSGNRILVFPIDASGSASPSRVISGAATGLAAPYGLIMDSTGDLIVTNPIGNSVETFASTASGNASPLRAIRGGSTQLDYPLGIALDHGGNVYVSNGRGNSVVRFAAASTGNVAPSVTIAGGSTQLSFPSQLGLDPYGDVFVANRSANTVTGYAAGARGNAAPFYVVGEGLACPAGLAVAPPKVYGTFAGPTGSADVFAGTGSEQPLVLDEYKGFTVTANWGPNDARNFCLDCNIGVIKVTMADATNSGDIGAPVPPYTGPGRPVLYLEAEYSPVSELTVSQIAFGQTPDIVVDDANGFGGTSCAIAWFGTDGSWHANFTPSETPSANTLHFPASNSTIPVVLNLYENYYALYCI